MYDVCLFEGQSLVSGSVKHSAARTKVTDRSQECFI